MLYNHECGMGSFIYFHYRDIEPENPNKPALIKGDLSDDSVTRVEKKYLLDEAAVSGLHYRLQAAVPTDPMSGSAGYMVWSLYFDTLYDNDYYDKQNGLESRKKVRLRLYAANGQSTKLELKAKRGVNQWKRSLSISRADTERLIRMDYGVLIRVITIDLSMPGYKAPKSIKFRLYIGMKAYVPGLLFNTFI